MKKIIHLAFAMLLFVTTTAHATINPSRESHFTLEKSLTISSADFDADEASVYVVDGDTLAAGSYMFRLVNPMSGGNIVAIYGCNDGDREFIGLVMGQRTYLPYNQDIYDDAELETYETAAGNVLYRWYFAGERSGIEFIQDDDD
ncbi:MAG: hypothetical protein AB7F59_13295 [Bdellovibrionales bacterium]